MRPLLGKSPFVGVRKLVEEEMAHGKIEDRITQEFKNLVGHFIQGRVLNCVRLVDE
jgi:hypothetical protein